MINRQVQFQGKNYKRVNKIQAIKTLKSNKTINIVGNNSDPTSPWISMGMPYSWTEFNSQNISLDLKLQDFEKTLNSFLYYLDRELGTYASYYIELK